MLKLNTENRNNKQDARGSMLDARKMPDEQTKICV